MFSLPSIFYFSPSSILIISAVWSQIKIHSGIIIAGVGIDLSLLNRLQLYYFSFYNICFLASSSSCFLKKAHVSSVMSTHLLTVLQIKLSTFTQFCFGYGIVQVPSLLLSGNSYNLQDSGLSGLGVFRGFSPQLTARQNSLVKGMMVEAEGEGGH